MKTSSNKAAVKGTPQAKAKATPAKKAASKAVASKPVPAKASPTKAPPVKAAAKVPLKSKIPAAAQQKVSSAVTAAVKKSKAIQPVVATAKASSIPNKPAAKPVKKAIAAPSKPTAAVKAKVVPASPAKKAASVPEAKPMTVKKVAAPTPPVAQPVVPVVATPAAPDQLVRATRPSARLAQITVPSLPPAVASTAAKASFMPSAPVTTVAPTFVPIKKDPKLANNWKTKALDALTDADILAMPDSEYMNSVQMAYFRRKLATLKQEILNSAGATTEHLREDTVVVPDPADRATIEEEHALELRTRDRERKLLKKIEQSIVLIDAGDYGYCDETGEPIGVGRLLARPTATLSLEAQQRRELKQKMFGD